MKFVIALALFAVAFAEEIRVVPLPEARHPIFQEISMGQLIIPNHIFDAFKNDMPVMREAVDADDEDLKVKFVDAPLEDAPEPVMLDEAAQPAVGVGAVNIVDGPVEYVRIAEPSLTEFVAEEIAPEPVQIANAPLPIFETVEVYAVNFVDAPLEISPEAVQLPEAQLPALETAEVEAVRIAQPILPEVVAEEIVPEPVQIAEAPLPAVETVEVNAAEIAEAPEPVRLAAPALPAIETAEDVEAVKIVTPQLRDYRGKQFNDPRVR